MSEVAANSCEAAGDRSQLLALRHRRLQSKDGLGDKRGRMAGTECPRMGHNEPSRCRTRTTALEAKPGRPVACRRVPAFGATSSLTLASTKDRLPPRLCENSP